jgi:hypothetical protein
MKSTTILSIVLEAGLIEPNATHGFFELFGGFGWRVIIPLGFEIKRLKYSLRRF